MQVDEDLPPMRSVRQFLSAIAVRGWIIDKCQRVKQLGQPADAERTPRRSACECILVCRPSWVTAQHRPSRVCRIRKLPACCRCSCYRRRLLCGSRDVGRRKRTLDILEQNIIAANAGDARCVRVEMAGLRLRKTSASLQVFSLKKGVSAVIKDLKRRTLRSPRRYLPSSHASLTLGVNVILQRSCNPRNTVLSRVPPSLRAPTNARSFLRFHSRPTSFCFPPDFSRLVTLLLLFARALHRCSHFFSFPLLSTLRLAPNIPLTLL